MTHNSKLIYLYRRLTGLNRKLSWFNRVSVGPNGFKCLTFLFNVGVKLNNKKGAKVNNAQPFGQPIAFAGLNPNANKVGHSFYRSNWAIPDTINRINIFSTFKFDIGKNQHKSIFYKENVKIFRTEPNLLGATIANPATIFNLKPNTSLYASPTINWSLLNPDLNRNSQLLSPTIKYDDRKNQPSQNVGSNIYHLHFNNLIGEQIIQVSRNQAPEVLSRLLTDALSDALERI